MILTKTTNKGGFKAFSECVFKQKSVALKTKATPYAIRPEYSLKSCPPAELFYASTGKTKLKVLMQIIKLKY
jgi:hypothetical protein